MKYFLLTFLIALTATVSSNAQTLQVNPIYIGGTAYFEVHNATPDAIAIVCYSTSGTGPFTLANGLTFDLSMPIRQLQPMVINGLGDGQLGPFPVPSNAVVGMQLWFQAVHIDFWANPALTTTNMVPITVQNTPNNPPTAVDDSASTRESVAVTIDVMANDSDIDGDGISLFSVSTPADGIAVINGGVIDYTPNTLFFGVDTFTYQLQDAPGDQDTATVTVTVTANNSPLAVDDNANVVENSVVLIDVLANDSDPDGDTISLVSLTAPTNGSAVIVNGQIEYTPPASYIGADTFTYTIEDSFAAQATATVIMDVFAGGSLESWGHDASYQVSNTPTTNDFIQVTGGHDHSVALRSDGTLVSWGKNDHQQVANTPTTNDFIQVAAGYYYSVALKSDGTLVSWGSNLEYQVSNTPTTNDFTQVSARGYHSVALRSDGTLVSWGLDTSYQVTNTPTTNDFIQAAGGGHHSVALRLDGSLVSWGKDSNQQVADTPTTNDFIQVSAGHEHSVALKSDGTLVSWGKDSNRQVADTPTTNDFIQVSAGANYSVALRSDGSLVSWGLNVYTQVSNTPTTNDFIQVAAGGNHSVAIKQ
jgi:hypothetical protein